MDGLWPSRRRLEFGAACDERGVNYVSGWVARADYGLPLASLAWVLFVVSKRGEMGATAASDKPLLCSDLPSFFLTLRRPL